MSRTYRSTDSDYGQFRKPKTRNEIRQLDYEESYDDVVESKHNRRKGKRQNIPTAWDDVPFSAYHENWDYRHSHKKQNDL